MTPPRRGIVQQPQSGKEGSRPLPTNNREVSNNWENANFRQVCRGRIYASRAVCPLNRIDGVIATGGIYAAPTEYPQYCNCRNIAGGAFSLNVPAPRALHIYYLLFFIYYLSAVPPRPAQLLLDAQQTVVFRHALAAAGRAGLDEPRVQRHR